MNLAHPALGDHAVREALYCAMDKKSIIDAIYYGLPHPTETFLPSQSWAYNPDLPKQVYDPAKAKQILDAAGWKPGAGGIREKNGVRLAFTNSTTAGNHVREQAQELLQQTWKEIGADMQIKNMPAAVIWGDYFNMSKYESVMVGQNQMTGPDPDVTIYYSSKAIAGEGRRRAKHHAVRQSQGGRAAGGRCHDARTERSACRFTTNWKRSFAMICRRCRSSSTRASRGRRRG